METGVFMFGVVEMDDAGSGPPAPTDRRYTQKQMWSAALRMLELSDADSVVSVNAVSPHAHPMRMLSVGADGMAKSS